MVIQKDLDLQGFYNLIFGNYEEKIYVLCLIYLEKNELYFESVLLKKVTSGMMRMSMRVKTNF